MIEVHAQPKGNSLQDHISKIIRAKLAAGVAQALEWQLCKHEALSLNPSAPGQKKK
jgi:hypothetical protein